MSRKLPAIATLGVLAALAAADRLVLHRSLLEEGSLALSRRFLLRTGVIVLMSWWLTTRWSRSGPREPEQSPLAGRLVAPLFAAAACCALLFLISPQQFTALALEDRPVEVLSAALLFGNCVFFAWIRFRMRGYRGPGRGIILTALLGFVALFFLVGMEEVSWFQRVLDVKTPGIFVGNEQQEMNLHNFATDWTENGYYFGSFVALALLPFLNLDLKQLNFFVPGRAALLAAASFTPFNYDMWNGLPTQTAFFLTAAILLFCARTWSGAERRLAWIALALVIAVQVVFLTLGHRFGRVWDVTEYKELFIPAAFLVYGLEIAARANRLRRNALAVTGIQ